MRYWLLFFLLTKQPEEGRVSLGPLCEGVQSVTVRKPQHWRLSGSGSFQVGLPMKQEAEKGPEASSIPQGFLTASCFLRQGSVTQRFYSLPKQPHQPGTNVCMHDLHPNRNSAEQAWRTPLLLGYMGTFRVQKNQAPNNCLRASSISLTVALSNPIRPLKA